MSRQETGSQGSPQQGRILWGAGLGLAAALGLGALAAVNQSAPELRAQAAGTALLALFLATPYLIAFAVISRAPIVRGPLLLAAGLLAFISLGVSLAGIGVVFLPSAILFCVAAARDVRRAGWAAGGAAVLSILAVAAAGAMVYGFAQRYSGLEELRCWETVHYADGSVETRPRQNESDGPGSMGFSSRNEPGVVRTSGTCTSDIVTTREAARSLGGWAVGVGGLVIVGALGEGVERRRRSPQVA